MRNIHLQHVIDLIETAPPGSDVSEIRRLSSKLAQQFQPLPETTFETVDANGVEVEWVRAMGVQSPHAILYLHGGSYITGCIADYRGFASRLSVACDARVLLVEYRLAPEDPFPAALEDAQAAYEWLLEQVEGRVIVMGDSAGGGLSLSLVHAMMIAGKPRPSALVTISPWVDLTLAGQTMTTREEDDPWLSKVMLENGADLYLQGADAESSLISPLYGNFYGFPPLLIMVGGREVLLSDSLRLAEKAANHGTSVILEHWHDMIHDFPIFSPLLPEADLAILKIGVFARFYLE